MDFPKSDVLFQAAKSAILGVPNLRIDPRLLDVDGSDANLACVIGAALAEEVIHQLALSDRARYLDTSKGAETDRLGFDWYTLTRKPSVAAIGQVQLSRPNAGAGAGAISAGARFQVGGAVFALTAPAVFSNLGLLGTTTGGFSSNIPASAQLLGAASGVPAGSTGWAWVDSPFDPTITIANAQAFIGSDQEDILDPDNSPNFKQRIRGYFPSVQKATLRAVQNGALSVLQVYQAIALETTTGISVPPSVIEGILESTPLISIPPEIAVPLAITIAQAVLQSIGATVPTGAVQCFIGDINGNSNDAIVGLVQQAMIGFRALGVYVQVIGSTPENLYVQLTGVSVPAGSDAVGAQVALANAMKDYVNNLGPGQTADITGILTAARGAGTQAIIPANTLSIGLSPSSLSTHDQIASTNQTFRTDLPFITVTG